MEKYNLHLPAPLREKAEKDMKAAGVSTMAEHIRIVLHNYPFRDGKRWDDQDMLDFAREYSKEKREPYVLESEESHLTKSLEKFKQKR